MKVYRKTIKKYIFHFEESLTTPINTDRFPSNRIESNRPARLRISSQKSNGAAPKRMKQ